MKKIKRILLISIFTLSTSLLASIKIEKSTSSYKKYTFTTTLENEGHYTSTVFFPSAFDADNMKIVYISPTISGVTLLETSLGKYFAKKGFTVIIPHEFESQLDKEEPNTDLLNEEFIKPAYLAKNFINEVATFTKAKRAPSIFLFGASMGGFSSIIIASELDATGVWVITAGTDFASIFANSEVKKIKTFRKNHMKTLGIKSIADYQQYLKENLKHDPIEVCQKIQSPVTQVIALNDSKVPTQNQIDFEKNCPHQKVIKLDVGHVKASLSSLVMRKKIISFFNKNGG